jgi:iron-sulfur cluster assembly accessory protein|tara:strand:- start:270 stop:584 length:315 start_codon:yes stop_codon:yes gene_type:complete
MIEVTDEAYEKLLERAGDRGGVRIALKPGGCAGFEYKFDYIDDLSEPDDLVMDFVTFKVAIDRMSLPMLDGATLDWTVNGINEEFIFRNPNEQSKCGCGVSAIF